MMYISGMPAFGVPCEGDSIGKWNLRKEDFLNEEIFKLRDSEVSPLGDWGIEENKLVPYREFCTYSIANHTRAYVDMLVDGQFEQLSGLFYECINSIECRKDIFMLVYGKLRNLPTFDAIDMFMAGEFGNAWNSYIDSINSASETIANTMKENEDLEMLQNA